MGHDVARDIHSDMGNGIASDAHCENIMGHDVARDIHCDVTMSNNVAMCTYHGITMHIDVPMNVTIMYYLLYA